VKETTAVEIGRDGSALRSSESVAMYVERAGGKRTVRRGNLTQTPGNPERDATWVSPDRTLDRLCQATSRARTEYWLRPEDGSVKRAPANEQRRH